VSLPPPPHVRIVDGRIHVDGRSVLLYGAEVQYFRIRDRALDPARTHAAWAETLDRLRDAGMNLVTTYVPWDWHEPEEGRFDFAGARDLGRFVALAEERRLHVGLKPGPLITAEWPRGFGTFGAVPAWWKERHPQALCRDRDGRPFSFHPLYPWLRGTAADRQPSLLAPEYLEAVGRWFEAVARVARPFVGPGRPVVLWQIDNETNFYWSDHYRIDFHESALAHHRAFLEARHGRPPPADLKPPHAGGHEAGSAHDDWFDAGAALIEEYHRRLRAAWEAVGIREPDVLFTTNDTPQAVPGRGLLLPHGPRKNAAGVHALDIYPRCIPGPGPLFDLPAQADLFALLFRRWAAAPLAVEVQAGIYEIPLLGKKRTVTPVLPEVTEQLVLKLLAHGMQAVVAYVLRGGWNADGSPYDFQAPLDLDGEPRPRYELLRRIGARLLADGAAGEALAASEAVEDDVAVAVTSSRLAPRPDLPVDPQAVFGQEAAAVHAWLLHAGANARAVDLAVATDGELSSVRALFFPCPGDLPAAEASKLRRYVEEAGGTLVCLLRPGPLAPGLFPAEEAPPARRFSIPGLRRGAVAFALDRAGGTFATDLTGPQWLAPDGAEPLLFAGGATPGRLCLGYARRAGRGLAVLIGPNVADIYNRRAYYAESPVGLDARRLLARRLLGRAGASFALDPLAPRDVAVARRVRREAGGGLLVFVFRGDSTPGRSGARIADLERVGIEERETYEVVERLSGTRVERPGRALAEAGMAADLPGYGSGVFRVAPRVPRGLISS